MRLPDRALANYFMLAIFYPFSQFCEVNISLLSLQTQPNTAPNLFQRGVEYGKYVFADSYLDVEASARNILRALLPFVVCLSQRRDTNPQHLCKLSISSSLVVCSIISLLLSSSVCDFFKQYLLVENRAPGCRGPSFSYHSKWVLRKLGLA